MIFSHKNPLIKTDAKDKMAEWSVFSFFCLFMFLLVILIVSFFDYYDLGAKNGKINQNNQNAILEKGNYSNLTSSKFTKIVCNNKYNEVTYVGDNSPTYKCENNNKTYNNKSAVLYINNKNKILTSDELQKLAKTPVRPGFISHTLHKLWDPWYSKLTIISMFLLFCIFFFLVDSIEREEEYQKKLKAKQRVAYNNSLTTITNTNTIASPLVHLSAKKSNNKMYIPKNDGTYNPAANLHF